jgi:hypothetical protein
MVMLLRKRNHVDLDRDVIFLAESGEEANTAGVGINFMAHRHYDAIDVEYWLIEDEREIPDPYSPSYYPSSGSGSGSMVCA